MDIKETLKNKYDRTVKKTVEVLIIIRRIFTCLILLGLFAAIDQEYKLIPRLYSDGFASASGRGDLAPIIEKAASKYDLPPLLIRAMIDKENGPKNDNLYCQRKYEQKYYTKAEKLAGPHADIKQIKLMASSLGVMQVVYAAHVNRCHLKSPQDLCIPEINIDCGASYVRFWMNKLSDPTDKKWYIKDKDLRIKTAVKNYNAAVSTNWKYEADVRKFYHIRKAELRTASNTSKNKIQS